MGLMDQLTEAWKNKQTDLSGQTWFDLPRHLDEATREENRLAKWNIAPGEWNAWAKRRRFRSRLWLPAFAVLGMFLTLIFTLLLQSLGAQPSGGLITAMLVGLPIWLMVGHWKQADKSWPHVDKDQEIIVGRTMAMIRGEPAVWDYNENGHQTIVRSVCLEAEPLPTIVIKTKSRGHSGYTNRRGRYRSSAIRYNWAIEIPVPARNLAEGEDVLRTIDKHATREFAGG